MSFFLLNVLPQIGTALIGLMYVPQILKTHKTKDVTGMSLLFWVMLACALSVLTANALVVFLTFGTFGFLITEAVNLALALVVLVQVLLYRDKNKKN